MTSDQPNGRNSLALDVVFYALLGYLALLIIPIALNYSAPGFDPSWSWAMNYLPASSFKYGPDFIFMYGPLGFICWPENLHSNLAIATVCRLFVWALLIVQIVGLYRRRRAPLACFVLVLSLILAQPVLNFLFDYLLVTTALVMIVRDRGESSAGMLWGRSAFLALLLSLLFLAKASGFLMLMPALVCYAAASRLERDPARRSWISIPQIGLVLFAPIAAYLIYNPSVRGLWAYLLGTWQIVTGYHDAMSTYGWPKDAERLLVFLALILGFAAVALWRKWLDFATVILVGISLYVAFKHGIARLDHEPFLWAFGPAMFAILFLRCSPLKTANAAGGLVFLVLAALSIQGTRPWLKNIGDENRWSPAPRLALIEEVFHWRGTLAALKQETALRLRADALSPGLVDHLRGAPVVVFPWELTYGAANPINILPLYVLQSTSAYTNALDLETADHLRNSPANTKLLVEWKSVDDRHPLLAAPATWDAMYTSFQPEFATEDLLLLKKRSQPLVDNFEPVKSEMGDPRQWQDVPHRDHAVSVSISLSKSLLGFAENLFYKLNPVYMEVETNRGYVRRFRVIPAVIRYPFVINCLPASEDDLKLRFEDACPEQINRIRLSGFGLSSFKSNAEIAFAEDRAQNIRFLPDSRVPNVGATVFGDEIELSDVSSHSNGSRVEMELHWKALRKPLADYMVFVHAVDSKGAIGFQVDHLLKNLSGEGSGSWAVGESVTDTFSVNPPSSCVPGSYALRVGVYGQKPMHVLPLTRSSLPAPSDAWKGQAVMLANVMCKPR